LRREKTIKKYYCGCDMAFSLLHTVEYMQRELTKTPESPLYPRPFCEFYRRLLAFFRVEQATASILSLAFYGAFSYISIMTEQRLASLDRDDIVAGVDIADLCAQDERTQTDVVWLYRGLQFTLRVFEQCVGSDRAILLDRLERLCDQAREPDQHPEMLGGDNGDKSLYRIVYDSYTETLYPHDPYAVRAVVYGSLYMLPTLNVMLRRVIEVSGLVESPKEEDVDPVRVEELLHDLVASLRQMSQWLSINIKTQ